MSAFKAWLTSAATATLTLSIAACGQLPTHPASFAASLPAAPIASRANHGRSWMLPEATSEDLLYVADTAQNQVDVYTYPQGKRAGVLRGFEGLAYMCVGAQGHVFIPNYGESEILEYAHGGSAPIKTLVDERAKPYSCAFDPKTQDLAVANAPGIDETSGVVLYTHAQGHPKTLYTNLGNASFVAYDDKSNLFLMGSDGPSRGGASTFGFEEFRKGGSEFQELALDNIPAFPNGMQWDGKYLAIGTGTIAGPSSGDTYVYHVSIVEGAGKTIGATTLAEKAPTAGFFIDGSTIVVTGGSPASNTQLFPYPGGGSPTKTLKTGSAPYGVVVSLAHSKAGPNTASYGYHTIFSFHGYDGSGPAAALTYYKGKLYGTTTFGGEYSHGTVFSVTPSGEETVLHSFGQLGDGANPEASVTALDGVLYGTTYNGGVSGKGTVFSITPSGKERVIYSFGGFTGANPTAGLTLLNGLLYGTTSQGGVDDGGTLFSITAAGKLHNVHLFMPYSKTDGSPPNGLVALNGKLYGTTYYGGKCLEGTVYSMTTAGKEHVLHDFDCPRYDGENPEAALVAYHGVLYGTTAYGGAAFYNDGTAFSLTLGGKETILSDFKNGTFGYSPDTALLPLNGRLYGTTPNGFNNDNGALYSVSPSGYDPLLVHTFGAPPDGTKALAGLTNVGGTLYGTTAAGGGVPNAGTVYALTP